MGLAARGTQPSGPPARSAEVQYCSTHCITANLSQTASGRVTGEITRLIADHEMSFPGWDVGAVRHTARFLTSYPQSVDAFFFFFFFFFFAVRNGPATARAGSALSTGHPQVSRSGQDARLAAAQVRLGTMRRIGQVVGAIFLLLGGLLGWAREHHGLTAFWDHWWCPIPLALIVLGFAAVLVTRRPASTA